MPQFIESLESRTFLSVAPSVAQLKTDGKTVVADLVALGKVGKANFKIVEGDLKSAGELRSSGSLLKALGRHGSAAFATLSKDVHATISRINQDVNKLVAAAAHLRAHPSSTTLQGKVTTAGDTLNADAAARLTIIDGDATTQQATDKEFADPILAANKGNTQLATDFTSAGQRSGNARGNVTAAVLIALGTDVPNVVAAFPA